jgi:hypothetical protein
VGFALATRPVIISNDEYGLSIHIICHVPEFSELSPQVEADEVCVVV